MILFDNGTIMSTTSSNTNMNILIPDRLPEDVKRWITRDVVEFLWANKDCYSLNDNHIDVIKNQEVFGVDFLKLTDEKLERWGLLGGPAGRIIDLVEKLKENKGLIQRGKW